MEVADGASVSADLNQDDETLIILGDDPGNPSGNHMYIHVAIATIWASGLTEE